MIDTIILISELLAFGSLGLMILVMAKMLLPSLRSVQKNYSSIAELFMEVRPSEASRFTERANG